MAKTALVEFEAGSELLAANGDHAGHAIISIAISLKRIADSLRYQPGEENLFDFIREIRDNGRSHNR